MSNGVDQRLARLSAAAGPRFVSQSAEIQTGEGEVFRKSVHSQ
jgi:hypothetical protein